LTDVGRAFLPHAEAMLAAHRDARDAVASQLRSGPSEVSLAVVGTIVDARLCARLKRFCRAHPQLRLTLKTGSSAEITQLVRQGEVTLAVRYFIDPHPQLTFHEIGREAMVVVAAADHPRITPNTRGLAALAGEPWLGFPVVKAYKEAFGRLLRQQLSAAGLDRVELLEVDSLSAQKHLAEAGFGLALLPKSAVRAELARGTLKLIRAPRIATTIPINVVHRKHAFLSPAARALLEQLAGFA
jgi:DNA-binding transcriptional LysR family regulator